MTTPSHPEALRVCLFRLAQESFALRLDAVSEIVPMAALSRPPSMPSLLEGFLNLGGAVIPVLRIAGLLGLPQERPELHTPLVILRGGSLPLALLVNRVMGIVSLDAGAVAPIDAGDSFNACVEGRFLINGDAVHLLSIDRLLLEKERQTVAEFQAAETRRLGLLEPVAS